MCEITLKGHAITLTADQAHALCRGLGYHLHQLVRTLPHGRRTAVPGPLAGYTRDDWDHAQADVAPGPGMKSFAVRVAGLAAELGQAEALRLWQQLHGQLDPGRPRAEDGGQASGAKP
jgi:hypothetical protein